jgi:hypothetical protein
MGDLPALDTFSRFTCPQIIPQKLAFGETCTFVHTVHRPFLLQLNSENLPESSFHRLLSKYASRTIVLMFSKKWGLFQVLLFWWTFALLHMSCIATPQQCTWTFVTY